MPRAVTNPSRKSSDDHDVGKLFVRWHFFTPFFAGILGLLATLAISFFTSTSFLFAFNEQKQAAEVRAAIEDALAKRQQYLGSYLAFIRDDTDFKNSFYYASDKLLSLRKPLVAYLEKHKPLLDYAFVAAVDIEGKAVYSAGVPPGLPMTVALGNDVSTRVVSLAQKPHLLARIPVRLFGRPCGQLILGFELASSFLAELKDLTGHDYMLVERGMDVAAATLSEPVMRTRVVAALNGSVAFPHEFVNRRNRYTVHEINVPVDDGTPSARLYAVCDVSEMAVFRNRVIFDGLLLFALVATVFFYVTFRSSKRLSGKVNRMLKQLDDYRRKAEREGELAAVGAVARQISHDIRSPLTALAVVARDVSGLPEEQRILLRDATGRIRDIANNLLDMKQTGSALVRSTDDELPSLTLLSGLVEALVSEKRAQHRDLPGVFIEADVDEASCSIFAKITAIDFKRALSNVIDNAVEAVGKNGFVWVSLHRDGGFASLCVSDNGRGIPAEVVPTLGQRGVTYGKREGRGLGLYQARMTTESCGGRLHISSEDGVGSEITVTLPLARPPHWFVTELDFQTAATVVAVDDDPTIHKVWDVRLRELRSTGVKVEHFSSPTDLVAWARAYPERTWKSRFLLDYEFAGRDVTGVDVAIELRISDRSVVVTSRYEDAEVVSDCNRAGLQLLPKPLASVVPVRCNRGNKEDHAQPVDAVLLDDDPIVRRVWQSTAKRGGHKLEVFEGQSELMARAHHFSRDTPIYIDAQLADGVRGESVAQDLHGMGFTNLRIATGSCAADLAPVPWVRSVVGKDPPWACHSGEPGDT